MMPILIFILAIYIGLIVSFIIGFDTVKLVKTNFKNPTNKFSIIIPFRNESQNLNELLSSILNINYPIHLFEVLLVNDLSEDNSEEIIQQFQLQHSELNIILLNNIRKTNSPKKDAINTAIEIAHFAWIVTTDADCSVPKNWLHSFDTFIQNRNPVFISAPVKFKEKDSFLFHFQNLNLTSLIGSTIGGFGIQKPFLCNGANLCYRKEAFKNVGGYNGNSTIASGDDIFLLEKMVEKFPKQTLFLKSTKAIVTTKTENTWKSFFNQQIRWVSKSSSSNNWFSKFVGAIVLLTNVSLIVIAISLFYNIHNWKLLLTFFLLKVLFDFLLIKKTKHFSNSKSSLYYIPIMSALYPFFTLFIVSLSLFKKYEWKGRIFSE